MSDKERYFVYVEPDLGLKIVELSVKNSLSKNEVINRILRKALIESPRGVCPALTEGDKGFYCVWFRKDKTPMIGKLANSYNVAISMCEGCGRTRQIKEKIAELEDKIKQGVKIPYCKRGVTLDVDGKHIFCRELHYKLDVKQCLTILDGKPCNDLGYIYMQGDLTEALK